MKALHKQYQKIMTIKVVPLSEEAFCDLKDHLAEIAASGYDCSKYLIQYQGFYYKEQNLWIVLDYCDLGSALDLAKIVGRSFSEPEIATIIKQSLLGLKHLHSKFYQQ